MDLSAQRGIHAIAMLLEAQVDGGEIACPANAMLSITNHPEMVLHTAAFAGSSRWRHASGCRPAR